MIKKSLIVIFLSLALQAVAQADPVLMRINGKDVFRSEFVHMYNKTDKAGVGKESSLESYLDRFIDFKLKVAAAEAAGIDTTRFFLSTLDSCRRRLAKSYLTDEDRTDRMARRHYDETKAGRAAAKVRVSHIFKSLPQNMMSTELRIVQAKMDSIYGVLRNEKDGVRFEECIKNFSDEKEPFWVGRLQMPEEFEDVVFSLSAGEISAPFFTPQGIHIVKVLERKEAPPFEEMRNKIIRVLTRRYDKDKGTEARVEKLKAEYAYTPDEAAMEELLSTGRTNRTLFTLGGKAYTGKDFNRFANAHPAGIRRQLKGFIFKSVLDYENNHLEQKYPEFRQHMRELRENILLTEIYNREIGERMQAGDAELEAYFDKHRSKFHWAEPRFKGIVLHCVTKRVAKQARKFLKQLPEDEWLDAIRLTINAGDTPKVLAEQGVFAPGDNAYVDDKIFKGEEIDPVQSFPFTVLVGKKVKGPEDYREVREQLAVDYRNHLERHWIKALRAQGKVEINQEVLKTVNNH